MVTGDGAISRMGMSTIPVIGRNQDRIRFMYLVTGSHHLRVNTGKMVTGRKKIIRITRITRIIRKRMTIVKIII
jgi:hypothetical protein